MFNMILGPARSGKSEHILRQMKALAAAGTRSILIVPESYSHQAERRMIELCGNSGGRWASVTTFSKLCRDILREMGLRPRSADAAGRVLYMYLALSGCQTALKYYKGAPKPQLISKLLETVDELVACRISPEALLTAAEQSGNKIRDLAVIYAAFESEVAAGGLDPRDPFDLACGLIAKSGIFSGAHVFIDGFAGFTAQRMQALARILECAESLSVALLLDEQDEVLFTRQAKTRDRLLQMASRAGARVKRIDCRDREGAPLARLARGVFFHGCDNTPLPHGTLEIYSCSTPHEECELAAALARRLTVLRGIRARQIAVVCPDMDGYGHMLENAFARYGVPLFLSAPEDVLSKPPVAAALGALYAVQNGLTPASVLDWLKSGLAGITPGQCDELECYALLWNIRGDSWLRPFALSTTGYGSPVADEEARLVRLNRIREAAAGPLRALKSDLSACKCGGDFARALNAHLTRIRFEKRLTRLVRRLEPVEPRLAGQYAQLYGAIVQAIAQLEGALSAQSMDLSDFVRLLQLALGRYEVDVIPVSLDAVQACAFERLPMGGITHVFILGAREGAFPPSSGGTGLLSESERIALETSGIVLTQTAEDMAFEGQSNIYRAIACGDGLVITAPQTGHDGGEYRSSYILERIKRLTGVEEISARAALSALGLTARAPAFEAACRAIGGHTGELEVAALRHFEKDNASAAFFRDLSGWSRRPRPPMTRPELIAGLYGGEISLTASRIEQLASCKFSYFMRYGLKAEPRSRARLGAPEMGSFVHEVVERAVRDLCRDSNQNINTLVQYYINAISNEFLRGREKTARIQAIFALLCENIISIVQNVWQEIEAGDFKPMFFELGFASGAEMPPLVLDAGDVRAVLRGKIDRADGWIDGDTLYLKVADYKTGRKSFRLSDVYNGLNLQMFIYLLMLSRADRAGLFREASVRLGKEARETAVGGALYIPAKTPWIAAEPGASAEDISRAADKELRRVGIVASDPHVLAALERPNDRGSPRFIPVGIKRGGGLTAGSSAASAHQLDLLLRRAEHQVASLARELSRGCVDANPYREGHNFTFCRWCDYAAACHFDTGLSCDRHRPLKVLKDSEVFERLEQGDDAALYAEEDAGGC